MSPPPADFKPLFLGSGGLIARVRSFVRSFALSTRSLVRFFRSLGLSLVR